MGSWWLLCGVCNITLRILWGAHRDVFGGFVVVVSMCWCWFGWLLVSRFWRFGGFAVSLGLEAVWVAAV